MTSSRPYLLRAIYDWIVDNGLTPYLLVNANVENVKVPVEYVSNGKIILNVAPAAVNNLEIGNAEVNFSARFSGNPMYVCVPMPAAMAIYAKENGRGMVFTDDDDLPTGPDTGGADKDASITKFKGKAKQPRLRVIK
ncbi:MAG: ClpXP protease specificity-enhancing factor [Gammaproteobacteria bacterium]|nr:ClpXP protease specificity-enhancing factor [Gammaproteobacteria bacterium]